ncbi:MAG: hypothetical protein IKA36_04800 [Clostridia bacterium]|nr:hypothetical protein [Clostridia bacterium]
MAEFNNKTPFILKEIQNWVTTKIADARTIIEEWCDGRFSLNTHNHDAKYDSKGSASTVQTNLNTHDNNTTKHITASERTTWNSKANGTHTHTTSQISGLDTALAGKASSNHSHTAASLGISIFPTWKSVTNVAANTTYTATNDGYLMLGMGGGNGSYWIDTTINGTYYRWNGNTDNAYKYGWQTMQLCLPMAKGTTYYFTGSMGFMYARFVAAI